ncbi:MAG: bifunctional nuclease family protein [Phycisphaerales bacterium]|nr:bifunctional nuclease family protein [Phycisphaerales bacterium]
MDVQMELSRIFIRELEDLQIIELTEVNGDRAFPIVVGINEAFAIERRLKGVSVPRPQTHELLDNVMQAMGGTLDRILIHELNEGTFYAMLCMRQDDRDVQVDARPSDAIALGVATGVPILVSEHVLEQIEKDGGLPPDFKMPDAEDEEQPPW